MQVKVINEFYDAGSGMVLRQKEEIIECTETMLEGIRSVEKASGIQLIEVLPEKKATRAKRTKRTKNADTE